MSSQDPNAFPFPEGRPRVYTNWARTALEVVVDQENLRGGVVMLPAFICQDSFMPLFERLDLTPRFVDVTIPTYHMDIEKARGNIEEVDAVLFVHAFGLPAAMEEWRTLCDEHDCVLVEDCARALGARRDGQAVGGMGDYAVYSLQKVTPVSKGGVVLLPNHRENVSLQRPSYGIDVLYNALPQRVRETVSVGYPLDVEPRKLDGITRRVFERYVRRQYVADLATSRERALQLRDGLEPLGFEFQRDSEGRLYLLLPALPPCDRDELVHHLMAYHIPHKVTWGNPWAKTYFGSDFKQEFPNAAILSERIVQFEIGAMDDDDVEFAIDRIGEFVSEFGDQ